MAQKKLPPSIKLRRGLVDPQQAKISVSRQCELLGLARSTWYFTPASESPENLELMRAIGEQYMKTPFYGSRRMAVCLGTHRQENIYRKRVQRLMRVMGLEAIYPKPLLSLRNAEHRIFPYLLRDVNILRPNQVWSTDITFIPMTGGYLYLVAVIDWYSRYVLAWPIAPSARTWLESTLPYHRLDEGAVNHHLPAHDEPVGEKLLVRLDA